MGRFQLIVCLCIETLKLPKGDRSRLMCKLRLELRLTAQRSTHFPQRDEPCNLGEGKFSPGSNFTGNFYRCPITNKTPPPPPPHCHVNKFVCSQSDVLQETRPDVRSTISCELSCWHKKAVAPTHFEAFNKPFILQFSKECSFRNIIFLIHF
jgi:hypothetical protein